MTVSWPEVTEEEVALFYTTGCWRLQRVCAGFSRCRNVAVLSNKELGTSLIFSISPGKAASDQHWLRWNDVSEEGRT